MVERIVLGSAQWGMPYGIANRTGQPSVEEIAALLEMARAAGIDTMDTARAYGESEALIGRLAGADSHWTIVTKLPPIDLGAVSPAGAEQLAAQELAASRVALQRERLDVLLLHAPLPPTPAGDAVWRLLRNQRAAGAIGALGLSARSPAEAWAALETPEIEVLQVAASLLDQRLMRGGFFAMAAARGKRLYARSIFLQGVAYLDALPTHLAQVGPVLTAIGSWAVQRGLTRTQAFLIYAREAFSVPLVIGCETRQQLQNNLALWSHSTVDVADLASQVPPLSDEILDPWRWPNS